jgi:5-methyltetrahydropteroyltriglutamate--homocysteine methyltransferase
VTGSTPLFPAQEIGSLAKPRWQLLGVRSEPLDDAAREEFRTWSASTGFADDMPAERDALLAGRAREIDPERVRDLGALFAIRFLESVGLARVYDGEARRIEMYEYPIRQMRGFRFQGHVRSFDNKYYLKAAVVDELRLERPYHVEEFDFVQRHARAVPKLPITGPYTLADWSYNEYYLARQKGWKGRTARRAAQREFVVDLARRAIRPTLAALIEHGCRVIQIDEPAAGTHPDEAELVVEGFNAATEGFDAEFSMHICYSNYRDLLPTLLNAKRCRQWAWEFANRDTEGHDGYEVLSALREYGDTREIGLGVVDVHRDTIEPPELVAARIRRAVGYLGGDARRIWVNPDCGLRTRSLPVARAKLESIVRGATIARADFESPRR